MVYRFIQSFSRRHTKPGGRGAGGECYRDSNVFQKHSSLAEVPFRCSFVILLLGKEKQCEVLTDLPAKAVLSPTASLLLGEFGGSSSQSKGKYQQNHLNGYQSDYPGLSTKTQGSLQGRLILKESRTQNKE